MDRATKISIIGAGNVGSTFAYALMLNGLASEIVLVDIDKEKAAGEMMDLNHALSFSRPVEIHSGDYEDCQDSDVIVITAGAAQKSGETRLQLVEKNVDIFRKMIPEINKNAPNALIIVVSNPVDILTYVTWKLSDLPKERVIGSGTILDTSRFRYELANKFGIDPRNIHAYIIGEHGDSEVPVWSLANVAGVRFKEYCPLCGIEYDQEEMDKLFKKTKTAAYKIIDAKGSTYYAIASGTVRIVESIIRNENAILTVSTLVNDYYDVDDICISVPAVVNRNGIKELIGLILDDSEADAFRKSANILKDIAGSLDL
ncbi:L-lactate dehydrogenase [Candidatus Poribacteria bacterium]|nr:L-lactate dehydrogenase [Candidatus Poribacteria bacterium]